MIRLDPFCLTEKIHSIRNTRWTSKVTRKASGICTVHWQSRLRLMDRPIPTRPRPSITDSGGVLLSLAWLRCSWASFSCFLVCWQVGNSVRWNHQSIDWLIDWLIDFCRFFFRRCFNWPASQEEFFSCNFCSSFLRQFFFVFFYIFIAWDLMSEQVPIVPESCIIYIGA
jgi:hypothetical protein